MKKLNQLIDLMLEEREYRKWEREEKERSKSEGELREYVKSKNKNVEPPMLYSTNDNLDRPVRTHAPICVPYNLTDDEKMIVEEFYNK